MPKIAKFPNFHKDKKIQNISSTHDFDFKRFIMVVSKDH